MVVVEGRPSSLKVKCYGIPAQDWVPSKATDQNTLSQDSVN